VLLCSVISTTLHSRSRRSYTGYLLVASAAVLWATSGPISRVLYDQGVTPLEVSFWRTAAAAVLFILRLRLTRSSANAPVKPKHLTALALFGAFGTGAFMVSLAYAIETGGINLAVILLYTSPVFVAVGARLWYHEPLGGQKAVLIAITMLGVVLIATGGGRGISVSAVSLAWGFAAAFTYATYFLVGKWAIARYSPLQFLAYVFPVAAVAILPFVRFGTYLLSTFLWLALLSVVTTYLPYLLYYRGLAGVQISRAVVVATVEPVIAAIFAAAFFGELYSMQALTGALFVLAAATRASMPERRPRAPSKRPSEAEKIPTYAVPPYGPAEPENEPEEESGG